LQDDLVFRHKQR